MNRKDFIRKTLMATTIATAVPLIAKPGHLKSENSTNYKSIDKVGFNHLPNKKDITMNTVLHKADTRGHANHGWLNTHHTFSFANYHNPERMHFGVLRVLNDDIVANGRGFGTHPHDNMEIISIPLEGDLEHKDSMGNVAVIKEGDVQVMSAGTGITHSEYNKNKDKEVKFLQIWVFPNTKKLEPRYDQISIKEISENNAFYQILSPNKEDQGVWINQDAWFHLGEFEKGKSTTYQVKKEGNGVYAFILEGEVEIEGETLNKRDGFGIWEVDQISLIANSNSKVLLMEVPMTI
jgi:quercetin 2,3-dioxygenase